MPIHRMEEHQRVAEMENGVLIKLGRGKALLLANSLEFMGRNLQRIASHLGNDRRARETYRQIMYDYCQLFSNLHDELQTACIPCEGVLAAT